MRKSEKRLPSRNEAEQLLEEGLLKNPGRWGDHSRNAAHCAEKIGEASGLDKDRCYVSGLLHDIGRSVGNVQLAHVYHGWKMMNAMGYPLIGRICLTHSFAMQEIDGYGGAFDLAEEEIEEMKRELGHLVYDDYDRLIQLCDNISGASGIMRMEDRIADIQSRYPRYPEEKKIITLRLVDYFSRKTGADIYDLACGGNLVNHY